MLLPYSCTGLKVKLYCFSWCGGNRTVAAKLHITLVLCSINDTDIYGSFKGHIHFSGSGQALSMMWKDDLLMPVFQTRRVLKAVGASRVWCWESNKILMCSRGSEFKQPHVLDFQQGFVPRDSGL